MRDRSLSFGRDPVAVFATGLVLLGGCTDDDRRVEVGPWTTETVVAGDTTVVRTKGASHTTGWLELVADGTTGKVDGAEEEMFSRIYEVAPVTGGGVLVYDADLTLLREYDAAGAYLRTFGRKGRGPGEYLASGGIAVAKNGNVLLFDSNAGRVNVFGRRGEVIRSWQVPSLPQAGARGLSIDATDTISIRTRILDPARRGELTPGGAEYRTEVTQRFRPDGSALDTIRPPVFDQRSRMLKIVLTDPRAGPREVVSSIPLVPNFYTTFSPKGYYVSGDAAGYSILMHRRSPGPLRIESDLPPVPADPAERAAFEAKLRSEIERPNSSVSDAWRIPEVKPFYNDLRADTDGRLWVQLHQPATRTAAGESASAAAEQWVEPVVYDMFASEGQYLGRVRLPERATFAAASADRVWLVVRNDLDVQQLARFRVPAWSGR
jgi:hypothetical protein